MNDEELREIGKKVEGYCKKYSIPLEYFFEILGDQKVSPMMRGKGMEYEIYLLLQRYLSPSEWIVHKLNLNPQPNMPDVDIGVTHRRTGIILKVESKPSVRESMNSGQKAKNYKVTHFRVKCHRSRSNIALSGSSNDRYAIDIFDIIITKPSNSIVKGKTIGPELELIQNKELLRILFGHYGVDNMEGLVEAINNDWRFVLPGEIAVEGFIPRTPYVLLDNDPHWLDIGQIESKMLEIVRRMRRQ